MSNIEVEGLMETIKSFSEIEAEFRKQANGELRTAAGDCARMLVGKLQTSAAASGVPVAPRVASATRVKSDRLPVVSIGGSKRVGIRGAPASRLLWGSEHGPKGDVNHFGVPPSSGYWIKPAVERFKGNEAIRIYRGKVAEIMRKYGLL